MYHFKRVVQVIDSLQVGFELGSGSGSGLGQADYSDDLKELYKNAHCTTLTQRALVLDIILEGAPCHELH